MSDHEEPKTGWAVLFNRLAPELRQMIWKEAVLEAMETPEVLILLPRYLFRGIHSLDKDAPFPPVNTAFPAVMHVNREARQIALMHVQMADIGPYPWNKCLVPQRPFRPEIDILYASHTLNPLIEFCRADVMKVQHLALDYGPHIERAFVPLVERLPALRTLRYVFLGARGTIKCREDLPFLPHRRYALRNVDLVDMMLSAETQEAMRGIPPEPFISAAVRRATIGARTRYIDPELCVITEFCYSPSGDSRFVAAGEEFPADSPDPSKFALYQAGKKNLDFVTPLDGMIMRGSGVNAEILYLRDPLRGG
ncbi:hypothetical protein F5Y14DRAFT_354742 [Nemania sp. NC0429]|nr:hypothetical protein F5Y14DRAFT_354742 [Nemania sp. NC0429]